MKDWINCTIGEKIERWENVDRVLSNLTPHERREHFDMTDWGFETDCGTIACAAGHCGLDPWFYRRGLSLNSYLKGETISYGNLVADFFGYEGSHSIFYNTSRRSVVTVIREVRNYIRYLKRHGDVMNDSKYDDYDGDLPYFNRAVYYRPV